MNTKKLTRIAVYCTLSLILSLVESALPPILWFAPGAKMGLANLAVLFALIVDGVGASYLVLIVRCLLAAVFGGNLSSLMYSLSGGLISLTAEVALVHFLLGKIGCITISIVGAVLHNVTQAAVASLLYGVAYLPLAVYLIPAGVIAGLFIGFTTDLLVRRLPTFWFGNEEKQHKE